MNKKEFLEKIIAYYLDSDDFNGYPGYQIDNTERALLIELIEENLIQALSEDEVINPFIKGFRYNLPIELQKKYVYEFEKAVCFYPTSNALKGIEKYSEKPYTQMLREGAAQFQLIFFNVEILERYTQNPMYRIHNYGYTGKIWLKDEYYDELQESEYIKSFGMGYIDGERMNRAIAVFVGDLSKLSSKAQLLWRSFQLDDSISCKVAEGFIQNQIKGEWVNKHWMFDALLQEMTIINSMCEAINIPKLFRNTYDIFPDERPEGYGIILLPTLKNYYDFVLVMEKLLVHNISMDTFQVDAMLIRKIERKKKDGTLKGSVDMLAEWLKANVHSNFEIDDVIIRPLKRIRKERQVPAHEWYNNRHDISVYEWQKELVEQSYEAVRALRRLFMGHPLATRVQIPAELQENFPIVYY